MHLQHTVSSGRLCRTIAGQVSSSLYPPPHGPAKTSRALYCAPYPNFFVFRAWFPRGRGTDQREGPRPERSVIGPYEYDRV